MLGQLLLLLCSILAVHMFSTRVLQDKVVVPTGDSSLCWVQKLDNETFYIGFKPIVSETSRIAYMSLYSCHGIKDADLVKAAQVSPDCSSAAYLNIKQGCGERLMFLWSQAMGRNYEEKLPAEVSGIKTGVSGYVMLVVTYLGVPEQVLDSSGLQLTEESGPAPSGVEGGRLLVSHRLPRLIVMGGVEDWRTSTVCHRSCLKHMEGDKINIRKVGVFTGHRGVRARLGVASEEGNEVDEDILNTDLNKGSYVEKEVARSVGPDNDLWLDCDYNTLDLNTTIFGGVGAGLEHCFAVITYTARTRVTSCGSHPTEYSVLYALDFYLENEDYNSYIDDYYVEDAFDSYQENNDDQSIDEAFGKRKKRSGTNGRNKREVFEIHEDNFFKKISDDNTLVNNIFLR